MEFVLTGLLCMVVAFVIQLMMCIKAKRFGIKISTAFWIIVGVVFAYLRYVGVFGTYSIEGFVKNAHQLEALVYFILLGCAALGLVLGWVAYGIKLKRENKL